MDFSDILAELQAERDRLDSAIAAVEKLSSTATKRHTTPTAAKISPSPGINRRGRMSAAARKRMSRIMKQRWAAKKRQQRAG